ncbi:MAG: hypothetical protein KDC92_09005, partial [Bacteroidetes bacterium]|nr:hypothetical protein [Bacteroidota bacterium]
GILQENIPVGAFLLSKYSVGFDALMHFYARTETYEEYTLKNAVDGHFKNYGIDLPFYVSSSQGNFDFDIPERHQGITITLPGFYGPQGRNLHAAIKFPDFLNNLNTLQFGELNVVNFEMECSGVFAMSALLGHECATVCVGLANRITGQFIKDPADRMQKLIEETLEVI